MPWNVGVIAGGRLFVLQFRDGDDQLLALAVLFDRARYAAFLALLADVLVVLLVAVLVEVVHGVLVVLGDHDDGGAGFVLLQLALPAGDLALERDFLAFLLFFGL